MSTPNPLGGLGVFPGAGHRCGSGRRLRPLRRHVGQAADGRHARASQTRPGTDDTTSPEVVNAWPVTNVDLKYQVNLDGEKTNFYQENQELDWQVRQWVKLNFDKNDMSDLAPLGTRRPRRPRRSARDMANASADARARTASTSSRATSTGHDYIEWTVQVTVPLNFDRRDLHRRRSARPTRTAEPRRVVRPPERARSSSSTRSCGPRPRQPGDDAEAYVPLVVDEKDPIRHKYGAFEFIAMDRDPTTQLLAADADDGSVQPDEAADLLLHANVPYWIIDAFIGHRATTATRPGAWTRADLPHAGVHARQRRRAAADQPAAQAGGRPDSGLRSRSSTGTTRRPSVTAPDRRGSTATSATASSSTWPTSTRTPAGRRDASERGRPADRRAAQRDGQPLNARVLGVSPTSSTTSCRSWVRARVWTARTPTARRRTGPRFRPDSPRTASSARACRW